jgi:hypothetical protein
MAETNQELTVAPNIPNPTSSDRIFNEDCFICLEPLPTKTKTLSCTTHQVQCVNGHRFDSYCWRNYYRRQNNAKNICMVCKEPIDYGSGLTGEQKRYIDEAFAPLNESRADGDYYFLYLRKAWDYLVLDNP